MASGRRAPEPKKRAEKRSPAKGAPRPGSGGGLRAYAAKRDFSRTPEPAGTPAPKGAGNSFVVQKHAARRLHYDFRLELGGVLKSWAVTKGPSLDPADRRLAVNVEDHPLEYGGFEGVIPQGQYGGGTVMLWDRGTWEPVGERGDDYEGGHLKVRLHGEKLHGVWALVRMGGKAQRDNRDNWLLIKDRDEEAVRGETAEWLEENAWSVASGRTMEQIAEARDAVWNSNRGDGEKRQESAAAGEADEVPDPGSIPGGRRQKQPEIVSPQLATLVSDAPPGDEWLHEIKFDGYRILCRIEKGIARLFTRSGLDWTDRFKSLAAAAGKLAVESALLDGEIVAIRPDGVSDFKLLQSVIAGEKNAPLSYYLFDLLHLNGVDLRKAALENRKRLLQPLVATLGEERNDILYSDHWIGHGGDFYQQACRHSLEGVISKRRDAPYRSGRGRDWLKTKCIGRQELVIGGFTRSSARGRSLRSLLLGYYQDGRFVYAGRVGTGFDANDLEMLGDRLKPLEQPRPAYDEVPKEARRGAVWVEPKLVCEVEFREWTESGVLRHPSYKGLREDKQPTAIGREGEQPLTAANPSAKKPPSGGGSRNGGRDAEVAGVRLSNPDKILYQEAGFSKRDLAEYYRAVADAMLPHAAGRPLSLVRCPEGNDKECFFQRHAGAGLPKGIRTVELEEKGKKATGLCIDDVGGLISLVQIGVLEIHPWGARSDKPDKPDRVIFDLDPDPTVEFKSVTEAAKELRERLDDLGLQSFVKTTGGKGLHVVVPLTRRHGWKEVKEFAHAMARLMAKDAPDRFTDTMSKKARAGRIYVDYLRNDQSSTAIAPYSTRARSGAPVALPLSWSQVTARLDPSRYTIKTVPKTVAARKSDPWEGIGEIRQSISAEIRRKLRLKR